MMYLASQLLLLTAPALASSDALTSSDANKRVMTRLARRSVPPPPPPMSEEKMSYQVNPVQNDIALLLSGLKDWLQPVLGQIKEIQADIRDLKNVKAGLVNDEALNALGRATSKLTTKMCDELEVARRSPQERLSAPNDVVIGNDNGLPLSEYADIPYMHWTPAAINAIYQNRQVNMRLPSTIKSLILDFCYGEKSDARKLWRDGFNPNQGFLRGTIRKDGKKCLVVFNRVNRTKETHYTEASRFGGEKPKQGPIATSLDRRNLYLMTEDTDAHQEYTLGRDLDEHSSWHITLKFTFVPVSEGFANPTGMERSTASFIFDSISRDDQARITLVSPKDGWRVNYDYPSISYGQKEINKLEKGSKAPVAAIGNSATITISLTKGVVAYCNHHDLKQGVRYVPPQKEKSINRIRLLMEGWYTVEQVPTPESIREVMQADFDGTDPSTVATWTRQEHQNTNVGLHTVDWEDNQI